MECLVVITVKIFRALISEFLLTTLFFFLRRVWSSVLLWGHFVPGRVRFPPNDARNLFNGCSSSVFVCVCESR